MPYALQALAAALPAVADARIMGSKTQAVAVAVTLGALIAAWGVSHFNEPQLAGEIRFSVPRQRYFVALGAHVIAILAIYAALYAFLILVMHPGLVECGL
jgi:hypothetical protein